MFVVDLRVALTSPSTWWCSQQNGKNESHHNAKICGSWKNAAVQQRWVRVCRNLPSTECSHKQLQHFHSRPLLSGFRPSAFTLLAGRTTRGNDRICCAVFSKMIQNPNLTWFLNISWELCQHQPLTSVCPRSVQVQTWWTGSTVTSKVSPTVVKLASTQATCWRPVTSVTPSTRWPSPSSATTCSETSVEVRTITQRSHS